MLMGIQARATRPAQRVRVAQRPLATLEPRPVRVLTEEIDVSAPLAGRQVVFGGSFDPPHFGHASVCHYLLDCMGADGVLMAPTYKHPFGKSSAPFEHRLEMCRRLVSSFSGRVQVSEIERDLGGEGRTYDLLTSLSQAHPQTRWALCVGADILGEVERWYRWDEICELAEVIVLGRGGYRPGALPGMQPVTLPEISSSEIRRQLGLGEPVWGWVPCAVIDYIHDSGLYKPQK